MLINKIADAQLIKPSDYFKLCLSQMHPATFALVMATGIIAIACRINGLEEFATFLSLINIVAYPILWILFALRVVKYPSLVAEDWSHHGRAPGYFTIVASTGVLATQMAIVHHSTFIAESLWWFCVTLWLTCTYTIFTLATISKKKPDLSSGMNGGWLISVVATQSVVVSGLSFRHVILSDLNILHFLMLSFWLGGVMLYLWVICLIFYRYMFFYMSPEDLMPPYWINMGAAAISTLAGAKLVSSITSASILFDLKPFILGLTVMFWATATWWIPMLLALGVWRHLLNKIKISYTPLYWGLVFPLGMYSVCTLKIAKMFNFDFLKTYIQIFVIAAVSTWLLTFLGLAKKSIYMLVLKKHYIKSNANK